MDELILYKILDSSEEAIYLEKTDLLSDSDGVVEISDLDFNGRRVGGFF